MADIHLQQSQLQENNNSTARDSKDLSREATVPNEMWAPGGTPGHHHRELPVDVPDTLLQQAYANKVMNDSTNQRSELTSRRNRSASHPSPPQPPIPPPLLPPDFREISLNIKNESSRSNYHQVDEHDSTPMVTFAQVKTKDNKLPRIIEITVQNNNKHTNVNNTNDLTTKTKDALSSDDETESAFKSIVTTNIKESNVDIEEDYPFAKEDYPTMLKTCSDDSASPRSSSGRSDSTAALDASLILPGKESPLYDARRIDLGSPCRPMPDIGPLFGLSTRETTSFDNPAYGLDLHDLHPGLLIRSDQVTDLTRLIGEQLVVPGRKAARLGQEKCLPTWNDKERRPIHHHVLRVGPVDNFTKSSIKQRNKKTIETDHDAQILITAESTDDLISNDLTTFVARSSIHGKNKNKKSQQTSSGYSTLRSDASTDRSDGSFLVIGSNRSYREVAVDCPPDFVPITKSHPIYPPPNKVEQRQVKDQDNKIVDNYSQELTTTGIVKNESKVVDDDHSSLIEGRRNEKVRSKVKSLFRQSMYNVDDEYHTSANKTLALYQYNRPICRILSNTLTPKLNRTFHDLVKKPEPCVGMSYRRIWSFRHNNEYNQNSRNSIKELLHIDNNKYDKVASSMVEEVDTTCLDNAENSALSNAYKQSFAQISSSSLRINRHQSLQDIHACLTLLQRRHTLDGTRSTRDLFQNEKLINDDNDEDNYYKQIKVNFFFYVEISHITSWPST